MTVRTSDTLDRDIDRRGVMGAVVTSMSWAATGVWVNLAPALSPLALVAWRLLLAAALFWLLFPRVRRGFGLQAWGLGAMLVAYYLAAVFAFQHAPVGEVALCIGCAPLFVLLYQALIGRWPTWREIVAVALTLAGLVVMVWPGLLGTGVARMWSGLLVALVAAALTAAYATLHRRLALRQRAPSGAEIGRTAFAPLGAALLAVAWLHGPSVRVLPLEILPVIAVIGLGIVSTALPTVAVAVASSRLPAFLNTLIRLTTPLFATGFGWAFLAQQPTAWTVAGGALILSGLFVQGVRARE
ncbi:DMT family transporter [Acidihalobacter yilgarnensis]|nr:DMT family transporter [Acidihalobacter yilgarnensis]